MANPHKRKGDSAEREVEKLISDLIGLPARRKLGAGRQDDMGDIDGIPGVCISVANRPSDTLRAVREKPIENEVQRDRMDARFAATFIRLRGGEYRVVLTPYQWSEYLLAAIARDRPL